MKALNSLIVLYMLALPISLGAMEILVPLLMLGTLILSWNYRKTALPQAQEAFQWSLPVGFMAAAGLYLVVIIGIFYNDLPPKNALHAFGKLRWVFSYFLLHNLFVNLKFPEKFPNWLIQISPVITAVALFAFSQYWTGFDPLRGDDFQFPIAYKITWDNNRWRSIGFFNSTLTYGYCFTAMACLLGPLYYQKVKNGVSRLRLNYFILSFVIILLSLATTYSRGVWLGLIIGLYLSLFKLNKKLMIGSFVAVCALVAAYLPFAPELHERIFSVFDMQYSSNLERIKIWRANWHLFMSSPILGVGYEYNDVLIAGVYQKLNIIDAPASHAHNTYMQFLSGTGLLGLGCFLVFIFKLMTANLKLIKQKNFHLYAGIFGALVSILVGGLTECNFKDAEVNHLFIFLGAILSSSYVLKYKKESKVLGAEKGAQ